MASEAIRLYELRGGEDEEVARWSPVGGGSSTGRPAPTSGTIKARVILVEHTGLKRLLLGGRRARSMHRNRRQARYGLPRIARPRKRLASDPAIDSATKLSEFVKRSQLKA